MNYLELWILVLSFLLIIIFVMYYKLMMKYFKSIDLYKEITDKLRDLLKKENGIYNDKDYDYNCGVLDSITTVLNIYLDFFKSNDKGSKND